MTDWIHAPEWAKYKATDSNGWMYWFEHKPTPSFNRWQQSGRVQLACRLDWKDTLEERPIQQDIS